MHASAVILMLALLNDENSATDDEATIDIMIINSVQVL